MKKSGLDLFKMPRVRLRPEAKPKSPEAPKVNAGVSAETLIPAFSWVDVRTSARAIPESRLAATTNPKRIFFLSFNYDTFSDSAEFLYRPLALGRSGRAPTSSLVPD